MSLSAYSSTLLGLSLAQTAAGVLALLDKACNKDKPPPHDHSDGLARRYKQ